MSSDTKEIKQTGEMLAKIEENVTNARVLVQEAHDLNQKIKTRYKKNAYGSSFSSRLATINQKMVDLQKVMVFKW